MTDPIDIEKLERLGHIKTQRHPDLPLTVCKYTREFQHRGLWDKRMLTMRGSVYDDDNNRVSQPLNKFFNYGEKPTPEGAYTVQEKLDGTCIVAFRWQGIPVVHTLGSFTSQQAQAARQHIEDVYGWDWLAEGMTFVFEWMDPDNFTALQYRGDHQLVLLAWLIHGWEILMPPGRWQGPRVRSIDVDDIERLQASVPHDQEGYVLVFDTHQMGQRRRMKIKGERYLALHRAKWGLSEKVVWECLAHPDPEARTALLAELDEEARMWFEAVEWEMTRAVARYRAEAEMQYQNAVEDGPTFRDQIERAKRLDPPYRHYCLMRLNGKDIGDDLFWKEVKPKGLVGYAPESEAT